MAFTVASREASTEAFPGIELLDLKSVAETRRLYDEEIEEISQSYVFPETTSGSCPMGVLVITGNHLPTTITSPTTSERLFTIVIKNVRGWIIPMERI